MRWAEVRISNDVSFMFKETKFSSDWFKTTIKLPRNVKRDKNLYITAWREVFDRLGGRIPLPSISLEEGKIRNIVDVNSPNTKECIYSAISLVDFIRNAVDNNHSIVINCKASVTTRLSYDARLPNNHNKMHKNIKSWFRRTRFTIDVKMKPINTIKINNYGLKRS